MTKLFSKNLHRSQDLLFLKSLVGSNACIQHEKALLVSARKRLLLLFVYHAKWSLFKNLIWKITNFLVIKTEKKKFIQLHISIMKVNQMINTKIRFISSDFWWFFFVIRHSKNNFENWRIQHTISNIYRPYRVLSKYIFVYPYNFRIQFSISDHCDVVVSSWYLHRKKNIEGKKVAGRGLFTTRPQV